jgi:hemerythrin
MSSRMRVLLAVALMAAALAAGVLTLVAQGIASLSPWLSLAVVVGIPFLLRQQPCDEFVAWQDEYSVGIETIDQDHKKLLSLINNLLAAQHCRTGPEFERQALDELMDYTQSHFKREEDLMREYGYPDYEGHKAQHDQMAIQAQLFRSRYEEKGHDEIPEVARYLKLWLIQHINGTDRKYVPFLRDKLGQ